MPPANIVLVSRNVAKATENDLLMSKLCLVQAFEFRRIIENSAVKRRSKKQKSGFTIAKSASGIAYSDFIRPDASD
jgi:hypothetical protein